MAGPNSGTTHMAREYFLRGVALGVVHVSGGKTETREAIVNVETVTFQDKGGTRKVSTASVTFLYNLGVLPTDTIALPGGQPRKVLKRTSAYAPYWPPVGFTTTVLLA